MGCLSLLVPRYALTSPEVEALCSSAPKLWLGLDYDGTLVPIAPRPEEARPTPAVLALLSQFAQTPSVEVAVLSGRPLPDLCALLPVPGIVYAGTHGLEIRMTSGETQSLLPAGAFSTVMARLRQEAQLMVAGKPGFLVEDKRHALALHYRLAREDEGERVVAQFLAFIRAYQGRGVALEVLRGKKVIEVRPVGVNKGKAVQFLLGSGSKATLPLYLGDDVTDEDAFRVLTGRGLTILVADPPRRTAAQYYLSNPEEVSCFLSRMLRLRQAALAAR
jgi:trehalose-phosphatase